MATDHAIDARPARDVRPRFAVRRIGPGDLRDALARGVDDFREKPSHLVFLGIIYPVAGLLLGRMAASYALLPLLFPLVAGFALLGPVAAIGLYELSRRREEGRAVSWRHALDVRHAPAFGAIVRLGLVLAAIFLAWLGAADLIYRAYFGETAPESLGALAEAVVSTPQGLGLAIVGCAVGFLFAALVLTISVVSFPLMLDRGTGVTTAVATSARAVRANPGTMALWGLIVAGGLVLGALPFLVGLAVVVPILGHATWHLYRKVIV